MCVFEWGLWEANRKQMYVCSTVCAHRLEIRSQNASNRQCESSSHFVAIVYFVLRRRRRRRRHRFRRHKEVLISMEKGQTNKSFASRIRIVEFSRFTLSQCIECRAHCDDKISTYYIIIVPLSLYRLPAHSAPAQQHSIRSLTSPVERMHYSCNVFAFPYLCLEFMIEFFRFDLYFCTEIWNALRPPSQLWCAKNYFAWNRIPNNFLGRFCFILFFPLIMTGGSDVRIHFSHFIITLTSICKWHTET